MHVRPSHAGETDAARARGFAAERQAAGTGGAAFADLLAKASTAPTASAPDATTPAATATQPATIPTPEPIHLRKGETATQVAGHAYLEIHGGKRDGMFINTSGNKRRGEAFTLVHEKSGRELHIYGSGKDKLMVYVSPPRTPSSEPAPPIKLREGETMTPVPGHHYAMIHGGERDGLLINTSRNKRRGETFVLVHKNGEDYHVYGAGKHRKVIKVVPHDPGLLMTPATQPAATGATSTGLPSLPTTITPTSILNP